MDRLTKEKRSWNMSLVRSKDTSPEKLVRSFLHKAGYRFRLHVKNLPGSPDIVLPKYQAAIFVHGCFWHRHGCKATSTPKVRNEFWVDKFETNMKRDRTNYDSLTKKGWRVLVVWECAIKKLKEADLDELGIKVATWLKSNHRYEEIG